MFKSGCIGKRILKREVELSAARAQGSAGAVLEVKERAAAERGALEYQVVADSVFSMTFSASYFCSLRAVS
jgi:hypothetical protein